MEKTPYEIWVENQLTHIEDEELRTSIKSIIDMMLKYDESAQFMGYIFGFLDKYRECGYDKVKELLTSLLDQQKASGVEDDTQEKITAIIYELLDTVDAMNFDDSTLGTLSRLLKGKSIIPLTGADDEWKIVMEEDTNGNPIETDTEQNKLCSAVFRKRGDNSTAKFNDAKIFSEDGGRTWFGAHTDELSSSVSITFPFMEPDKPEFIYLNGKDSTEVVTDPEKIKELFNSSITIE